MFDSELERFLLHGILVAGKSATVANAALERFLESNPGNTPFAAIRALLPDKLLPALMKARSGNYLKNSTAFAAIAAANLDLRTCTVEDLENIYGIGPKTARYFLLYTRNNVEHAALDTHVLKYLRDRGHLLPKKLSRNNYRKVEKLFLQEAEQQGLSCRELDAQVWDHYSKGMDLARERMISIE